MRKIDHGKHVCAAWQSEKNWWDMHALVLCACNIGKCPDDRDTKILELSRKLLISLGVGASNP